MKVLHTIADLETSSGGPASCVYELTCALHAEGVAAEILTLEAKSAAETLTGKNDFIHFLANDVSCCGTSGNFRRALQTQYADFEIYHANGLWNYASWETARFCLKRGMPYVLTLHGALLPYALTVKKFRKSLLRKFFWNRIIAHAAGVHVTSQAELQHFRALGFTNPAALIPPALAVPDEGDPIRETDGRKRILYLGRLHPIKNVELLLRAWELVNPPGAELLIAGAGDERYTAQLKAFCRERKLDNVTFCGFVSGEAKGRLLAKADALVLASKMENFGMVVPEALLRGVPVIAGDHTPWAELPAHDCGWYVPTAAEAIAKAFREVLALPAERRHRVGEAALRYARERFSAKRTAAQMAELYRYLLHDGDKPDFVDVMAAR